MKTIHIFIIFIIIAFIQLFIPTQMIFNQENILDNGTAYKFKTQPIDPTDSFRGKFITLSYEMNSAPTKDKSWQQYDDVYVYLKTDNLGFAELDTVSKQKLEITNDYVLATVSRFNDKNWNIESEYLLYFNLPFDRFYMEESKAYDAELAFRKVQQDSIQANTYSLVYVKNGEAVLDNVFINDIPIAKYVDQ